MPRRLQTAHAGSVMRAPVSEQQPTQEEPAPEQQPAQEEPAQEEQQSAQEQ